jgi:hypothetical protein
MAPVRFPIASVSDPLPAIVAALRRIGRALRRLLPG